MPYVRCYDLIYDLAFQIEVPIEAKEKMPKTAQVSDVPWDDLPIMPRYRSQWPEMIAL